MYSPLTIIIIALLCFVGMILMAVMRTGGPQPPIEPIDDSGPQDKNFDT